MRPVSAEVTIDAPRELVFDALSDLSRRPAFTDHFAHEYRLVRLDPVGVGAAARFRIGGTWMDTEIVDAKRPHTVREAGRGGRANRLPIFTVWELAEGPGASGCEVRVTFWSEPAHIADKLRNPLGRAGALRREWRRALRRLRDLVEEGSVPEPVTVAGGDRVPTFVR